jgi:hypothetical protein
MSPAPAPKQYLFTWLAIVQTLGLPSSRSRARSIHALLRRLNRDTDGPIVFGGRGKQPFVGRDELLAWWQGLGETLAERAGRPGIAGTVGPRPPAA